MTDWQETFEQERKVRERLSKVQRTLLKLVGQLESCKMMLVNIDGSCEAPCIPICCDDCPFGEVGDDLGMIDDD